MQVEHMVFSKTAHPMFYPPPRIQYLEVIWVPRTGICLGPRLSPFCSCGGVCMLIQATLLSQYLCLEMSF